MVRLVSVGIECFSSMVFIVPAVMLLQFGIWKQRSFRKFMVVLTVAVYFMAVYSVTGLPSLYTLRVDFRCGFVPFIDIMNGPLEYIKNSVLNIFMFVPFGFLIPAVWSDYRSVKKMAFAGLAGSAIIELLQIFTFRFTDIDDLIMNTLGAVIGYGLAKMVSFRLPFRVQEQDGVVWRKYEPIVIFGVVFLIGFCLKPLVADAVWEAVLAGDWWERIK